MTKKKVNCRYELLCLLNEKEKNQEKYEKMIGGIENLLGKDNIEKIEEKDWKPVYRISQVVTSNYLLIYFKSERQKAKELEKSVLQSVSNNFLNRYLLLNLTDEPRNKIKLKKNDVE